MSATGIAIAPVAILSGKLLLCRWFDIVANDNIAITEGGYLNNVLALQWIRLFYQATKNLTQGTHRANLRPIRLPSYVRIRQILRGL